MDLAADENSDAHCVFLIGQVCPLGCGRRIMGKKVEEHVRSECRKRKLPCPDGCGECITAGDLQEHSKTCPMAKIFARADSALEFLSLVDLNDAVKDMYGTRGVIRQNLASWGQTPLKGGWGSEQSADKVKLLMRSQTQLSTKAKAKSADKLQQILARLKWKKLKGSNSLPSLMGLTPSLAKSMKYVAGAKDRLRTAVFEPSPEIQALAEAIVDLQVAEGNKQLQIKAENVLLGMLKEMLTSAINLRDAEGLGVVVNRVKELLPVVKAADKSEVLQVLLQSGDELHVALIKAHGFEKEFFDAVLQGDVDTCQKMVAEERANPSACDPKPPNLTPLIVATKNNDLVMVEFLMMHGADIHASSSDGFAPIHWACHNRQEDMQLLLLSFQANPCLKDKRGHDALMKLLRRRDINKPPDISWNIRKDLRLPGVDLSGSGEMSVSEAQAACIAKHQCFGFHFRPKPDEGALPQRRLQINLRPEPPSGWDGVEDPGQIARRTTVNIEKRRSVGGGLILEDMASAPLAVDGGADAGASVSRNASLFRYESIESEAGESRLSTAELKGRDSKKVSKKKANDDGWWTYIKVFADMHQDLRALIQFKADTCAQDSEGQSALHHHLRNRPEAISLDAVEMLLEASADVNCKDKTLSVQTPFLLAIKSHRMDIVNMMIQKADPPPDVDARGLDGVTACRSAMRPGSPSQVVKELRQRGGTDWADTTLVLGGKTHVDWDTRNVIDFAPLEPQRSRNASSSASSEKELAEPKEKKSPQKEKPKEQPKEKEKAKKPKASLDPEKEQAKAEFEKWIIERYDGEFDKAFKSLDSNRSGSITKSEFVVALTTANYFEESLPGRRRQDADVLFRMMDENGGGDITVKEFREITKGGLLKRMKAEGLG
eukprot:gnl/MRDRNA2_/MRDRNA2_90048_c0_seq1.p1 gnl/MRDRNA2_/MRDRNA2_90048_c0~~gnl/MRDRNA2_/MRDRNA2_90048_c0_seq1.p1  ORF type:complete len:888 (+),score=206.34 gnl/MRDRNA2_/MRDRNA2_90048_c0_seq1:118-2781(+)